MPSKLALYLAAICTLVAGVSIALAAAVKYPDNPYADQAGLKSADSDFGLFFGGALLLGLLAIYLVCDYVRQCSNYRRRQIKTRRAPSRAEPKINFDWPVLTEGEDQLRSSRQRKFFPEPQDPQNPPVYNYRRPMR